MYSFFFPGAAWGLRIGTTATGAASSLQAQLVVSEFSAGLFTGECEEHEALKVLLLASINPMGMRNWNVFIVSPRWCRKWSGYHPGHRFSQFRGLQRHRLKSVWFLYVDCPVSLLWIGYGPKWIMLRWNDLRACGGGGGGSEREGYRDSECARKDWKTINLILKVSLPLLPSGYWCYGRRNCGATSCGQAWWRCHGIFCIDAWRGRSTARIRCTVSRSLHLLILDCGNSRGHSNDI